MFGEILENPGDGQDTCSSGRDLNAGPPKYDVGMLTTVGRSGHAPHTTPYTVQPQQKSTVDVHHVE